MKSLLTPETHNILHIRVFIAKTTNIFNIAEIARGWEMSRHTLYRYVDEKYREQSRIAARQATTRLQSSPKGTCYKCKGALKSHLKCPHCKILVHDEECSCSERYGII